MRNLGNTYFMSCGKTLNKNEDVFELLGPNLSGHPVKIVNYYFTEDNYNKICVSTFKDNFGEFRHEVYYFKNKNDNVFYRSRCFKDSAIPKKYNEVKNKLNQVYMEEFKAI